MTQGFTRSFLQPAYPTYGSERIHFRSSIGQPRTTHEIVEEAVRTYRETKLPNPMFSDYHQDITMLWVPTRPQVSYAAGLMNAYMSSLSWMSPASWLGDLVETVEPAPPPPPEPEFEVNLMEPLVGWKAWRLAGHTLFSANQDFQWTPDESSAAVCGAGLKHPCPTESCSCGIYAADRDEAEEYVGGKPLAFVGEIYGWGRYVRGNDGWRAQYAYPKSFHLKADQASMVETLRRYHVPIYVEQPICMYTPEEDGYECRTYEAYGDLGAVADTTPTQAGDSYDPDEDDD